MADITKTIYVTDSCITKSGSTAKQCSAVLSGDTDCISDYTVEGTEGGTACCSDTTSLCMNAWIGCPLIFTSVTWLNTITESGSTYTFKSYVISGSKAIATYEFSTYQLSAPTLELLSNTRVSYGFSILNSNSVKVNAKVTNTLQTETTIEIAANDSITLGYNWGDKDTKAVISVVFTSDDTTYAESTKSTLTINKDSKLTGYYYSIHKGITIDEAVSKINAITVTPEQINSVVAAGKYILPVASSTILGGVKIGKNLTIESDGTLNASGGDDPYELPVASPTILGGIKIGNNLSITDDGTVDVKIDGTTIQKGTNGLTAKQVDVSIDVSKKLIVLNIK